jgi:hypothetical protein
MSNFKSAFECVNAMQLVSGVGVNRQDNHEPPRRLLLILTFLKQLIMNKSARLGS